ncbi:MAG TPA: ATP-binding protein [Streptosporangiaceae bacterium]|nr:ATP-binding protein [Streptosporangiaceae bacterium]
MVAVVRRRRLSVRARLTGLYGILFVLSGALVLAISGGVTISRTQVVARRANGVIVSQVAPALPASQGTISHQVVTASFIALGFMALISVFLGWLVAGRALRPVRDMTRTAQRISEDSLNERLSVDGPRDELKVLGDTIDGLLERLEAAFSAQRRFVANASHELRTPLATMRASIDVAMAKPEPAPPQTVALAARLRTELDRVDALLEAFLVLARAQHRDLPGRAILPLDYLVSAALADRTEAIAEKRLVVQDFAEGSGAWVAGSLALLSRLVENVLDNAITHNEEGGWIAIYSSADEQLAELVVENGGKVLSQEQAGELAQPFRRFGADRTGSDNGSGLGLSIVAAIVSAHDGRLDLRARPGGGLTVRIELPVATTPAPVLA